MLRAIRMEWTQHTIAENQQNDGRKKRKRRKEKYNLHYCWPAVVQFESDGVVGSQTYICMFMCVFALGRFGKSEYYYIYIDDYYIPQIRPNTNYHK